MKVLVNALTAKKIAGGGFQIALNFIKSTSDIDSVEWCYFVSQDIDNIVHNEFADKLNVSYFVFPTQPDFRKSYWKVRKAIKKIERELRADLIYSITSPSYFRFSAPEVMRFANAWVTSPNTYANKTLSAKARLRNTVYCWNQKRLLKKRQFFITQSETVKQGLLRITRAKSEHIQVIPNVLPAFYANSPKTKGIAVNSPNEENLIYIACVAVPVPHKNIDIIPEVLYVLKEKYSIKNVRFLTTIPDSHDFSVNFVKRLKGLNVEYGVVNYGYCTQDQLIDLYSICDMCFMPTLLETFSASLLEAMFFNLAVIATDFSFNKDITGDAAVYFSPTNAGSAAERIACLVRNPEVKLELKAKMPAYLDSYISYDNHMNAIVSFLLKISKK